MAIEYRNLRQLYSDGKYRELAQNASTILCALLREVYQKTFVELDQDNRKDVLVEQDKIGEGRAVGVFDLDMMARLVQSYRIPAHVGSPTTKRLLRTFNYEQIAEIIAELQRLDVDRASDDSSKLSAQQVILSVVALLKFLDKIKIGTSELLSEPRIVEEQIKALEKRERDLEDERQAIMREYGLDNVDNKNVEHKIFNIFRNRGLLVNPHDDRRNVSFKVETFVNLLGEIQTQIIDKCVPSQQYSEANSEVRSITEVANEILRKAGYSCGLRFGRALYELFQREPEALSLTQKINRWCEFDSDVGFGRFRNEIVFDESTNTVSGKIVLADNFLVANRDSNERNVCSFMSGYIQGVLDKIVRIPTRVQHTPSENCEQTNPLKAQCDFIIVQE